MRRREPHWECFCMHYPSSRESYLQIIQLPHCVFPRRSSSIRGPVVAIQQPYTRPVSGHIFWGVNVQSLRSCQCLVVPDRQT